MAGPCVAPELPPGTPTSMEEGTPAAAMEATPGSGEDEGAAVEEEAPAGTPADPTAAGEAEAALENLFNCINGGDYLAAAALMTDNFIQNLLEVPTPYDVPATFEGVQPVDLRSVSNAQTYADGRISVDAVYTGLFNGPGALGSARWFFVEEDGTHKLDHYQDVPLPEGVLSDATVIDVQMVDFAFALSEYTVPANTPVIFRTTNNSGTGTPHVNIVLTYQEGTTAEGLIEGEVNIEEASTGFYGAIFLEPGQSGDLAFESLAPGTYFLVCDVETEDGTPHYELGMVSQVTVE
jgi:uncharacterized cupredoxin-like copper-binding protein